jgi:hypothetical protein
LRRTERPWKKKKTMLIWPQAHHLFRLTFHLQYSAKAAVSLSRHYIAIVEVGGCR